MFADYTNAVVPYVVIIINFAIDMMTYVSLFISHIFTSSYFKLILLLLPPLIAILALIFKFTTQQFQITSLMIEKSFPGLSRKQIKLISKRSKKISFPKDSHIIVQGDPAKECFILQKGHAQVFSNYAEIGQTKLAELKPGDLFGEMGLLEARLRSATVIASQNCECIRIDAATFAEFITENRKENRSQEALNAIRNMADARSKTNKAWLRFKD